MGEPAIGTMLAEQCADLVLKWWDSSNFAHEQRNMQYAFGLDDAADDLKKIPEVAAALAMRDSLLKGENDG